MQVKTKRAGFAAAAALIAITSAGIGTAAYAKHTAKPVACYGVNSCKGESDCKSGNHACKGQNECKGQGFKDLTAEACAAAGGTTTPPSN